MKKDLHPKYEDVTFVCMGCKTEFKTRTTGAHESLGVCSGCHPFFTGKHKLVDTAGRVERFRQKYGMASKAAS
ncbi:MAG: 50S ribosomal protein L31 [Magnetococcales bacterium]|nr:50S ribosomal protein L31 [Magnetococcales bacterium]